MFGHPALERLFWLKLRGGLRMQIRRLHRPSSWIFLLVGVVLVGGWIASFVFGGAMRGRAPLPAETRLALAQAGIFALVAFTLVGGLSYRGLYVPKEEIELLFSGPLARGQIIRYRLGTNLARSLASGLVFGVGASLRAPHPLFGFLGTLTTMMTVPILGQAAAVLLGDAENRIGRVAKRLPMRAIARGLALVLIAGLVWLFTGGGSLMRGFDDDLGEPMSKRFFGHPVVHALLLPFTPWARAIVATSADEFWPWYLFCLGFGLVAFEATSRITVDFRELSLDTAADVAKRIQKMRRGGLAGAHDSPTSKGVLRAIPWLFGRGPFGAVAWLKLSAIARKSRTTLLFIAAIVALVVAVTSRGGHQLFYVVVGASTFYLCLTLKLDFRTDLELMDRIKAWPLAPWKIFLATILPESALVACLAIGAGVALAIVRRTLDAPMVATLAAVPPVVLTWSALDNAVFLFLPVRFVPGQEGALQHIGRSVLISLARIAIFCGLAAAASGPAWAVWYVAGALDLPHELALALAFATGMLGAGSVCAVLVWIGGRMLARFDVARDRPV